MSTILVTGAAGFIGSWVCEALLQRGNHVIGLDNFNDYYDVNLKKARAKKIEKSIQIIPCDISDYSGLENIFKENKIDKICHLAAQAGVRHSLNHPFIYETTNILGFLNILELCRHYQVKTLVYASSSSVYGGSKKIPFSVDDPVDQPISIYAATKKSNELMAHSYHHLFGLNCTGLRYFTVYGPWGRPDMAIFSFVQSILNNKPIEVFNFGKMKRDFTYISDVVAGTLSALDKSYPYEIFNLGNSHSVELMYVIECLENQLGKKAEKKLMPIQLGDIPESFADIKKSEKMLSFKPQVKIEEGIKKFVEWYLQYQTVAK